MSRLNTDCSMPAAVITFVYTIINAILFFTSIYTLYKFCKDYKVNVKKRPPRLLFYPGLIFFVFSSFALLATVRNAMQICFHGGTNYMDFNHWIYFIIFYGAQTYLLWLVLFMRLHYVFNGSHYALSKFTIRIHIVIFIFIPFATPFYFIVLWLVKGVIYTLILLVSFAFIIIFSCCLSALFIYKLFQVFKNMETNHVHSRKKLKNNKLLSTITKSTMLAVISLSMTLLTPITLLFGYYAISHSTNQSITEAGACLLAFCSLFDVYTNLLCILLSYSCFDKTYTKLCGKCDVKCRIFCIEKIMKQKSTKSGHIEISSMTKTSCTSIMTQETHFTSVTPPNGGDGHGSTGNGHDYEAVEDTDYDETYTETTKDLSHMPTPFTQENGINGFQYNIPEENENEFQHDFNENDTFKQKEIDEGQNIYTIVTNNGNVVIKGGVLHQL
eukprot:25337_1